MTNCLCGDPECPRCFPLAAPREVEAAADDMARQGLKAYPGDPLPDLLSGAAADWIDANQKYFRFLVWAASQPQDERHAGGAA